MATIINNLPKGNVKAPQGAIMKINQGEGFHRDNFDNNTEFVLEFTPDNEDPNGNPVFVPNGLTDKEITIGNQVLDQQPGIVVNVPWPSELIPSPAEWWGYLKVEVSDPVLFKDIAITEAPVTCNDQSLSLIGFQENNYYGITNQDETAYTGNYYGHIIYVTKSFSNLSAGNYYAICHIPDEFSGPADELNPIFKFYWTLKEINSQYLQFKNGQVYVGNNEQIQPLNQWIKFYENETMQYYNLNNNFIGIVPFSDASSTVLLPEAYNNIWSKCISTIPYIFISYSSTTNRYQLISVLENNPIFFSNMLILAYLPD